MISLRTLILLGATVYLLPKDPEQQRQFETTVSNAATRISTFCERQPDVCKTAGTVYADLKDKAYFGAGLVYALAIKQIRPTGSSPHATGTEAATDLKLQPNLRWDGTPRRHSQTAAGTLTSADLEPAWIGNR